MEKARKLCNSETPEDSPRKLYAVNMNEFFKKASTSTNLKYTKYTS